MQTPTQINFSFDPPPPPTINTKPEQAMALAAEAFQIPLMRDEASGELSIDFMNAADSHPAAMLICMTAYAMRAYADEHQAEIESGSVPAEIWLAAKGLEHGWRMYEQVYTPDCTMSRIVLRALLDGMAEKDGVMVGVMAAGAVYAMAVDREPHGGRPEMEEHVVHILSDAVSKIRRLEARRRA